MSVVSPMRFAMTSPLSGCQKGLSPSSCRTYSAQSGYGGRSLVLPSHTTIHAGPHSGVRRVELDVSSRAFYSTRASKRFGPFADATWSSSPEGQNILADYMTYLALCCLLRHGQGESLPPQSRFCDMSQISKVSSTAFAAQPPDLPPVSLTDMGFAIIGLLARHRRPRIRFLFVGSRLCSALVSGPASRRV
jgi:hypothetical protein